jgi:SAM-dependent methyltransferase
MTREYQSHSIVWTRERAARLWDDLGRRTGGEHLYFSAHSGRSVLRFVRRFVPLRGRKVLDFGCGRGAMLRHLLAEGIECQGVEFSAESACEAERLAAGHPLFRGVTVADRLPTPIEPASVDAVLLVEVVEHLLEEDLEPTLAEVRRLLRPGGHTVVTTPHAEDLAAGMQHCPECGATFHQWQHVRSIDAPWLSAVMRRAGFEEILCRPTLFPRQMGPASRLLEVARGVADRLRGRPAPAPHLVYVGRRPAGPP